MKKIAAPKKARKAAAEKKPGLADGMSGPRKRVPLPFWFSDAMAQQYVGMLPARFAISSNDQERMGVFAEANLIMGVYLMLVYEIYPKFQEFKTVIDSNRELSKNFSLIKSWLDENQGPQRAESYKEMMSQMTAR